MARVYLSLGSNVDPEENLRLGIEALRRQYGELELSPVYRSEAVGFDGDDFLNLVVGLDTRASPGSIHEEIERIHAIAGRVRGGERFSARTLDIDLLLYGDCISDEPGLRLPRADVLEYSFVLRPLAEIAPDLEHPVTGRTMREHWQAFDAEQQPLEPVSITL